MTYPASPRDAATNRVGPDSAQFWAGAVATAVVAALIALVGILICRWTLHIPILAPRGRRLGQRPHRRVRARGGADRDHRGRPAVPAGARHAAAQHVLRLDHGAGHAGRGRLPVQHLGAARPEGRYRGCRPGARNRDHVAAHRGSGQGDPPPGAPAYRQRRVYGHEQGYRYGQAPQPDPGYVPEPRGNQPTQPIDEPYRRTRRY